MRGLYEVYIPNLGPIRSLEPFKKFSVGGGWNEKLMKMTWYKDDKIIKESKESDTLNILNFLFDF